MANTDEGWDRLLASVRTDRAHQLLHPGDGIMLVRYRGTPSIACHRANDSWYIDGEDTAYTMPGVIDECLRRLEYHPGRLADHQSAGDGEMD